MKAKPIYVTQILLAKLLDGITPRWVQTLTKGGILKKSHNGKYDLTHNVPAFIRMMKSQKDSRTIEEVKKIHLETKTKKLAIECEQLNGSLVPATEYREQLKAQIEMARFGFRNLGWKLAPVILKQIAHNEPLDVAEKSIAIIIQHGIDQILRYDLAAEPRPSAPTVRLGQSWMLDCGAIQPNRRGMIVYNNGHTKELRKASEVIKDYHRARAIAEEHLSREKKGE